MEPQSTSESQEAGSISPFRFVDSATRRVAKRRSNVACVECRRRKVRCDIIKQKPQFCTNCRLDGVICEVKQHKKQQRTIAANSPPMTPISDSVAHQVLQTANVTMNGGEMQGHGPDKDSRTEPDSSSRPNLQQPDLSRVDIGFPPSLARRKDLDLPSFVKPLSTSLREEEWQYLHAKRCFTFPPLTFQKIIISRFAEYVYPLLPVSSIDDHVTIFTGSPIKRRVSLTLYHALMGAGLAAVEDDIISQYGYNSKAAARDEFYSKAKALLDVNAETGRLVTCQAALLLVGWSTNNDPKDGFHWSGIAINQALSMSLHKPISTASIMNLDSLSRRRIWWTIVMQEADVCLVTGRPPRLTISDTPEFQVYDAIDHLDTDYHSLPELERMTKDSGLRHLLQIACIEKAKLSLIILRLMAHLHGVDRSRSSPEAQNATAWQLDALLHDWEHNLPEELRRLNRSSHTTNPGDVQLTISMVVLTYLMALIMLHKSEVPNGAWAAATKEGTGPILDDQTCWHQAHARSMRRAADDITEINTVLSKSGLTNVIPGMGIPILCAAVGVHLLDARSNQDAVQARSFEKLEICLTVLRDVGKLNYTAKEITKLVESAVSEIRLSFCGVTLLSGQQPRQLHLMEAPGGGGGRPLSSSQQLTEEDIVTADPISQEGFYSPFWTDPFMQMESFFSFGFSEDILFE